MRYGVRSFQKYAGTSLPVNLLNGENDFGNAAWAFLQQTTVANPGAANQALMETATTNVHDIGQAVARPAAGALRFRLLIDAVNNLGRDWVKPLIFDNTLGSFYGRYFNLATGAVGSAQTRGTAFSNPSVITPVAISGGYRVGFDIDTSGTPTSFFYFVYIATADNTDTYAGNIANGLTLRGAKLYRIG